MNISSLPKRDVGETTKRDVGETTKKETAKNPISESDKTISNSNIYDKLQKIIQELKQKQDVIINEDIEKNNEEINKEKKDSISSFRLVTAFVVALLSDTIGDYLWGGLIPGIGSIIDLITVVLLFFILGVNFGKKYSLFPGLVETLPELVLLIGLPVGPIFDGVPFYTISIIILIVKTGNHRRIISKLMHRKNVLQKSMQPAKGLYGVTIGHSNIKYFWVVGLFAIGGILYLFFSLLIPAIVFVGLGVILLIPEDKRVPVFFGLLLIGIISIFMFKFDPLTYITSGKFTSDIERASAETEVITQNFNIITRIKAAYDKAMWETLGYGYYEGEVEKNKKENLGVYINKLDTSMYSPFYSDSEIVVLARLRGRSFKDNMNINTSCYLKKLGTTEIIEKGVTDPQIVRVNIPEYSFFEDVFCTFQNKSKGKYIVDFTAEFDFETWAYTKYIFVDRDLLRIYGEKINSELDIEQKVKAVYTNGPVKIGISSEDYTMPIPINKNDLRVPGIFGVTVENKIGDGTTIGEVIGIKSIQLIIPNSLSLSNCRPTTVTMSNPKIYPENDKYIFYSVNDFDLKNNAFRSVMCTLHVENYNMLLGSNPKSVKSMIIKTTYRYRLKKSATLNVEDQNAYLEYE
ncbi:MAG: hypothetical protein QXG00_02220 [Candidatus Woesearchaeota archaeon]